jgi:hypothetical protein
MHVMQAASQVLQAACQMLQAACQMLQAVCQVLQAACHVMQAACHVMQAASQVLHTDSCSLTDLLQCLFGDCGARMQVCSTGAQQSCATFLEERPGFNG